MNPNLQAMEYIWERIPKQKDGLTIRYTKADVDYLYFYGFVDTRRVKLEEWRLGLKRHEQADGSFVLNKAQFLTLRYYRYFGPAGEPFDAMSLREGSWTDAELTDLYTDEVYRTSDLNQNSYWAYINSWKESGHVDDAKNLIMDEPVKFGLAKLIERYPSPLRRLEEEVQRLKEERSKNINESFKTPDKSGFSVGKTQVEDKLSAYQKLQSKTTIAPQKTVQQTAKPGVDIKKLRKPSGKIMG